MERLIQVPMRRALAALLAASLALSGCTREGRTAFSGGDDAALAARDRGGPSSLETLPADTDPCAWVPAAGAERLLGSLSGPPWRADDAESPEPKQNGRACVYPLAAHGQLPTDDTHYWVAVELVTEDATAHEVGAAMVKERVSSREDSGVFEPAAEAIGLNRKTPAGWDNATTLPGSFVGRVGAIAIQVQTNFVGRYSPKLSTDSIERLAVLVRDRIPDIPIASPHASRFGGGGDDPDPCTLLTRQEAEVVLGALTVPPYRSNGDDDLADPSGEGCSYYTGAHRVFTIKPEWENGKTLFRMLAGFNQGLANAVGIKGESADTLDGPWDQVGAGIGGTLYFLTGDRMLAVSYRTSSADATGALRLATLALKRLSSTRPSGR